MSETTPFPQSPVAPQLLEGDTEIQFRCHRGIACFNACCRDLSQVLTPYDVLRLARGLGLRTGELLRRHTACRIGPGSGLPVVSLVPGDPVERTCPFLLPSGCRVYPDRPSSCRTYPLMRAVRRNRATGRLSEEFLLLRELAEHPCQPVLRGELLTAVWGCDFDPRSNIVDVCVRRLRSKLGFGLIKTVRGEGYQLAGR